MPKQELTKDIIEELKKKNEGRALFKKEVAGQEYVITPLTREKYQDISEWSSKNPNIKMSAYDEKIVESGLLWPQIHPTEEPTLLAGLYPTLAEIIKEKSLLTAPDGDFSKLYTCESLKDKDDEPSPTQDDIDKIKSSSPWPLHLVHVRGEHYIVRPLLRHEWNQLSSLPENMDTDVECCNRCVSWPSKPNWGGKEAGIPSVLSRHIMLISGFSQDGDVTEL